jgi:hypothetical protein
MYCYCMKVGCDNMNNYQKLNQVFVFITNMKSASSQSLFYNSIKHLFYKLPFLMHSAFSVCLFHMKMNNIASSTDGFA